MSRGPNVSETTYAKTDGGYLAYQLAGQGERDLLFTTSPIHNIDLVVGSGIEFDDRGSHELKGVPGEWRLFAVKN